MELAVDIGVASLGGSWCLVRIAQLKILSVVKRNVSKRFGAHGIGAFFAASLNSANTVAEWELVHRISGVGSRNTKPLLLW